MTKLRHEILFCKRFLNFSNYQSTATIISRRFASIFLRDIPYKSTVPSFPNMASSAAGLHSSIPSKADESKSKIDGGNENGTIDKSDDAKRLAAYACVDKYVQSGYSIGTGTGSTAQYAIYRLAEKYRGGQLKDIVCVPSSFQARQLIIDNGLPLGDLDRYPELDVCIDGADEVDEDLSCIKGGGGCLTQEKIVMSCSKYFYIIADSRKMSTHLGDSYNSIPLEVMPMACAPIKRRVEHLEGGQAQLRMSTRKAGPVITDNGNFILDWKFPKTMPDGRPRSTKEWTELNVRLKMIPGIVETGLFVTFAQSAFFGQPDGNVIEKKAQGDRRISPSIKRCASPGSANGSAIANGAVKD